MSVCLFVCLYTNVACCAVVGNMRERESALDDFDPKFNGNLIHSFFLGLPLFGRQGIPGRLGAIANFASPSSGFAQGREIITRG